MEDKHNLQRFLSAQGDRLGSVMQELNRGKKWGHWMWYVFPQVQGLGRSPTSERYAIHSEDEAFAYLHHPVLGPRLLECTKAVNGHQNLTAEQIFGYPDYLKFRSCMTLFAKVAGKNSPFSEALEKFFVGEPDTRTLSILETF
ncbi:MAG: calpastatin [Desulfobacterales bacterium PC51MH44]|nr:MAG: calpastatin [Desulfobacterales bacterium PC51MH44]